MLPEIWETVIGLLQPSKCLIKKCNEHLVGKLWGILMYLCFISPLPNPNGLVIALMMVSVLSHFKSCPILCYPMDCSLSGFSVYVIFQVRMLELVALPSQVLLVEEIKFMMEHFRTNLFQEMVFLQHF